MRKVYALLALTFIFCTTAADTADMSLISLSVQIDPATARAPLSGLEWHSSISSNGDTESPNGEMEIADAEIPFTHQGFLVWTDPILVQTTAMPFGLDVPEQNDENNNGIGDFFDAELPTRNLRTSGRYQTFDGDGADFTANWTRAAGEMSGTVVLNFPDLGLRFTHDYRILSYRGKFEFTRTGFPDFAGTVALTNALMTEDVLRGPLSLTLTNNNQFGYAAGEWIQSGDITNKFTPIDALDRIGTNFLSLIELQDGYPATATEDYPYWFFVIHSSDTNQNNILDLVETPHGDPLPPAVSITRDSAGVQLTVEGRAGDTVVLEETDNLTTPVWTVVETIVLPADAKQTLQRPASAARKFFRARAP